MPDDPRTARLLALVEHLRDIAVNLRIGVQLDGMTATGCANNAALIDDAADELAAVLQAEAAPPPQGLTMNVYGCYLPVEAASPVVEPPPAKEG